MSPRGAWSGKQKLDIFNTFFHKCNQHVDRSLPTFQTQVSAIYLVPSNFCDPLAFRMLANEQISVQIFK